MCMLQKHIFECICVRQLFPNHGGQERLGVYVVNLNSRAVLLQLCIKKDRNTDMVGDFA